MDFLQWKIVLLVYYLILRSAYDCDAANCSSALGMESGAIKLSQITATGFSPNDPVLNNARYDCCKTKLGTTSGLCFNKKTKQKTLGIDIQGRMKITKLILQAPSDASVGYVTKYNISYQDSGDHQIKQYADVTLPGILDPVKFEKEDERKLQLEPFVSNIFIDIVDFKKEPCLRIEFFGCKEEDVCKNPCLNGGKCIDYDRCECKPNYAPPERRCKFHYPDMTEDPVLEVVTDPNSPNSVKFICKISQRSGVKHNASLIIDGKVVKTGQPTNRTILVEFLQTDLYDFLPASRTGWGIACQASACNSTNCPNAFSKPRWSQSLTPTIQVSPPYSLERMVSSDTVVRLAGPPVLFLDPNLARNHGSHIEIDVEFHSATNTKRKRRETEKECLSETKYPVVEPPPLSALPKHYCGPAVTSDNWNDSHPIAIRAVDDGLFTSSNAITKTFDIILKHLGSNGTILQKRKLHTESVSVSNFQHSYTKCNAHGDPHIQTFDKVRYLAVLMGEFIMYRNKDQGYQVNLYLIDCELLVGKWTGVTCVCGAAIKVGDDVIVVSSCPTQRAYEDTSLDTRKTTGKSYSFKIYIFLNGELTKGTRILSRDEDVLVLLPTGTSVTVKPNQAAFVDVYIEPSLKDKRSTEGLCGFYDGECTDDLRDKNNNIFNKDGSFRVCTPKEEQYDDYVANWRVTGCASLFRGTSKNTKFDKTPPIFCRCTKDSSSNECGEHFDSDHCQPRNVEDITKDLVNNFSYKPKECSTKRRRRDVVPDEEEDDVYRPFAYNASYVPSTKSWPTKSGHTAESAKKLCQQVLNTEAVKNCEKFANASFESEIDSCIFDIKMTDSTTYANGTLDMITSECSSRAEKYPTDVFKELPGGMKMEVLFDSLCKNNCSNHGVCKDGLCLCEYGYFGSECSMTKTIPPTLNSIPRDGLCNSRRRNCSRSEIYGRGHIKSADLVCRVTPYDPVTGVRNDTGHYLTRAVYFDFNLLLCPHHYKYGSSYMVAVSNDNGTNYSREELLFMSYDAACHKCTIYQEKKRGNCTRLNTGCVIGKQCYLDNQTNPNNECDICTVELDRHVWSLNRANDICFKYPVSDGSPIPLIAGLTSGIAVVIFLVLAVIFVRRRQSSHTFEIQKKTEKEELQTAHPMMTSNIDSEMLEPVDEKCETKLQ